MPHVRLNQRRGSLTADTPSGAKVTVTPQGIEVSSSDANWLIERYPTIIGFNPEKVEVPPVEDDSDTPVVPSNEEPEPAPVPEPQPETTDESTDSGAISVDTLSAGGRKGTKSRRRSRKTN